MKDVSGNESASNRPLKVGNDQVTLWVPGRPVGQGAIRHSKQGFGYHANAHDLKPWREKVAWCAKAAKVPLLLGAVQVEYRFVLLRPKTVTRDFPTTAPDLDHYIRALGDALKGIAFTDDSLICSITSTKVYGAEEGVEISVSPLTK